VHGHFLAINCETNTGGVVFWTTTSYCRRMQETHRNGQGESDSVATSGPHTRLRKKAEIEKLYS